MSTANYQEAQVLDKLKKYTKAWRKFKQANKLMLKSWAIYHNKKDYFIQTCNEMINSHKTISFVNSEEQTSGQGEDLIFIVGFPRSGTTLLDSVLSAHTDTCILEEAPLIGETYDQISNISPKNYARKLSSLTQTDKQKLRKFYYQTLTQYSDWDFNGVLVDKSPLNTLHIGLIKVLFPMAKIIFSQRHPLDVCLSCYFQDFKMNSFMTNLTSINKTAKTYNAMLEAWNTSVKKFHVNPYYQSYEKLVTDFETETKKLINYLGLTWQDQILNYQETLSKRGAISTPSYNQVNQPIYQSAKNRYKNYLPYMDEAIEILQPWMKFFEYKLYQVG
jgi:hypothetical protein